MRTLLDEHPDWVDVALDITNAFNSMHRRAFLDVIAKRFPGLWDWTYTMYGAPTELYVRTDGAPPEVILSRCGTRQGCCLGAQFFALGLHPILIAIASLIGDRGMVISYADDIHLLCPPHVIEEIMPLLAASAADPSPLLHHHLVYHVPRPPSSLLASTSPLARPPSIAPSSPFLPPALLPPLPSIAPFVSSETLSFPLTLLALRLCCVVRAPLLPLATLSLAPRWVLMPL